MNIFPPVSVAGIDTAKCHGGNGYRGKGTWKKPYGKKNRLRTSASEPLDLSAVLGEGWQSKQDDDRCRRRKISTLDWNEQRLRQRRVVYMQKKLKSLSICMAPPSGVFASLPAGGQVYPQGSPYGHTPTTMDPPITSIDTSAARLGQDQRLAQWGGCGNIAEQKIDSNPALSQHVSRDEPGGGATKELGSISLGDRHDTWSNSATKGSTGVHQTETQEKCSTKHIILDSSAVRISNTTTKMFIDRKYNAEMVDACAALRELVREQAEHGKKMHRLRPQVNLNKRGGLGEGVRRRHDNPAALAGLQGRRHREKALGGSGFSAKRIRRRSSALRPLLFYSERAFEQYETTQMGLEDSTARSFARWEEARQRKLDYATYYTYAERYGPLSEQEFNRNASSPGRAYYAKAFDAARSVQVWWWTFWPPLLRRRKAAALAIQATFRGYLQRRKWGTLIKLRVLWGKTRIIAHTLKVWRHTVARTKRVKAFACRLRKNCKASCFAAMFDLLKQRREARQYVLRKHLQRVSVRVQLRVFEAWAQYAEKSLAVTRMNFRSVAWSAFTVWRLTVSEIRRYTRLRGACAVLAGRVLRRQCSGKYRRLKSACIKVQRAVRVMTAWARVQRSLGYERERRAREIVQLRADERIQDLLDTERKRQDRFQEIIYQDAPRHQRDASIFLRTAAGRRAVASAFAGKISESEHIISPGNPPRSSSVYKLNGSRDEAGPAATKVAETEAEDKVIRMFILREQAVARHNFDAAFPPPPLRCPRPDCNATFVERAHCVRHGTDVHPQDSPEMWTLTTVLSDSPGMLMFEEYLHDLSVYDSDVDEQNTAIGLLELWKCFQEWRTVPSSSDRFEELTQSTWVKCEQWVSNVQGMDQPYVVSEGEAEWTNGKRRKPFGLMYSPTLKKKGESTIVLAKEHGHKRAFQVQAIEDASWQVLAALHKSIGGRFLQSKQYDSYLDGVVRMRNRDIAAVAAEIAEQEHAKWSTEARSLRQTALRLKQDASTEALAMEATECVLREKTTSSSKGFLEGLVDDQAALLAVIIIAERTAFVKVISAVWNQAVDEAAHLITREKRGLDPRIVEVFSDAASTLTQANLAEALIDQAVLGLTGPDGEFWPDARAVAAVADGIAYRVRSDIMDELLEAAVSELECSGESESLIPGHTVGIDHGDEEDGAGGDSITSSGVKTPRGACADGMNTDDLYRKEEPKPSPALTMI